MDAGRDEVIVTGVDGNSQAVELINEGSNLKATVEPVSYTHLDVYKRQLVHREVDDPAEFIAFFVHVARHICAERLDHDADGLGGLFACGEYDQHVRRCV